jgi:hypothetical protein
MFMVEECIQNKDTELTNTKCTTIILSKGGDNFFMAHIEDRERYERLVDVYALFMDRTVTKTKEAGLDR